MTDGDPEGWVKCRPVVAVRLGTEWAAAFPVPGGLKTLEGGLFIDNEDLRIDDVNDLSGWPHE